MWSPAECKFLAGLSSPHPAATSQSEDEDDDEEDDDQEEDDEDGDEDDDEDDDIKRPPFQRSCSRRTE